MNRVLVYLGRFAIIIIGYAVAALAASAFLNVVTLGALDWKADEAPLVVMGSLVFSIPFIALFVAYFAFIPAVPAILLGEIFGKRDWLFYAVAGAVIAVIVIGFIRGAAEAGNQAIADPRFALAIVGGGLCGGIAYWAVAGRIAGNWRDIARPGSISPGP